MQPFFETSDTESKQDDLDQIMLKKDPTLLFDKDGMLSLGKWYTESVKKLFNGDINSFVKAREIYKAVIENDSSYAFLYRRPDLKEIKILYTKSFEALSDFMHQLFKHTVNPTDEQIASLIAHITSQAEGHEKKGYPERSRAFFSILQVIKDSNVIKEIVKLIEKKECFEELDKELAKELGKKLTDKERIEKINEKIINTFFERMNEKIEDLADQEFFKNDDIQTLRIKNVIYNPNLYHKWTSNLAWLLANLKCGKDFLIISDIAKDRNKFRDSEPKEYSAFAREICAAIKAGYELKREENKIFLTPSQNFNPNKCTTNGLSGNGLSPSTEEIEDIYSGIQKKLLLTGNVTFIWGIKKEEKENDSNKGETTASLNCSTSSQASSSSTATASTSTTSVDSSNTNGLYFFPEASITQNSETVTSKSTISTGASSNTATIGLKVSKKPPKK